MMVYQKSNSSEEIMKMDMEYEEKMTFRKGSPCKRTTGVFVFLGTVCMIIFMIMTIVIFFQQQRTVSVLESLMNVHSSNKTSVKPDLQITERQQVLSDTEVKSLMNNLSSSVSALTSKLNDAVGNKEQKQTETQKLLDNLKSAVSSLQSDLQNKQRDFESLPNSMSDLKSSVSDLSSSVSSLSSQLSVTMRKQDMKSLIDSFNSAVSTMTSKLNDTVNKQDQKEIETERLLDSLKSFIQSDQQNKQRDFESLKSSLSDLKSSVSDLSSSVASLSSKQQASEERVMNALKDLTCNMSDKKADVPVTCKSGWISYKSSCFLFSSNKLNWNESRAFCKAQGALLLKIQDNDEEWAFLNQRTIPTSYWVGLTDQNTGQWRWADDTPYTMNKERWNPGQPDDWTNHGLGEGGEDCGHIVYTGKLNDSHCNSKMKFICRV